MPRAYLPAAFFYSHGFRQDLPVINHNHKQLRKTMKFIFKFLKPYRARLTSVALLHIIATLSALFMPYVMSYIVDEGIKKGDMNTILISGAVMLALSVISLVSAIISNKINARVTTSFSRELLTSTYRKINSLSEEQYGKIGPSGLLTRSTDDIFNLEGAASGLVSTLVTVPIMLIGGTLLSFSQNVMLSLIFLFSVPPVLLVIMLLVKPMDKLWDKSDAYVDEQNKIVRERLSGLRVVRAFNNEEHEHQRAKRATEEMSRHIIKANVFAGFIEPIGMLMLNLATVIMLSVGANEVAGGRLSDAGDVISVIQYVALIANAVLMLSWTIAWIPKLKVSARRVSEIFSLSEEDVDACDEVSCPVSTRGASIELRKVSFTYPDARAEALTDISMTINEGERVAVIGGTGAGKSTLVKLLLALYPPTSGEIYLNTLPYSSLKRGDIREAYSTTLQASMIFEGTVRDNINLGADGASDEALMSAAEICELRDFITSHDEGLSYMLVGMGRNVSGGQKQRINMTRCAMSDAPIYIFDDSFSALDYLTERRIQEKLKEKLRARTVITVTQRVSTALSADKIFVMDAGRLVASGTHGELLRSCEIYREIATSQLGKEAVGGEA